MGYLKNMLTTRRVGIRALVYDSDTEANFATQLENNEAVRYTPSFPAGSKCRHRWEHITQIGRFWWR